MILTTAEVQALRDIFDKRTPNCLAGLKKFIDREVEEHQSEALRFAKQQSRAFDAGQHSYAVEVLSEFLEKLANFADRAD